MAYANITDPSAYFQTTLYTGNGSTVVTVTNDGNSDLQPDLLWFKRLDGDVAHVMLDTTRGAAVTSGFGPTGYSFALNPNSTATGTADSTGVMTITSNGFTSKEMSYASGNVSTGSMCCWQWHCNAGTVTTVSESGSNPGFTRQTSTDAGLSIIAYTGTGSNGTIAHGLPSTPEMIIFKRRNNANVWAVWHKGIGDDNKLVLNELNGNDADAAFMNSTLPTSTNITVGGSSVNTNADGGTYICYAWSSIKGYSKFGTYKGNASTDGVFEYCGFKPRWIMIKSDAGIGWFMHDTKRSPHNVMDDYLRADTTGQQGTSSTVRIDFLSNGFKLRYNNNTNFSNSNYSYMAFAEHPFVGGGVPTTAR